MGQKRYDRSPVMNSRAAAAAARDFISRML